MKFPFKFGSSKKKKTEEDDDVFDVDDIDVGIDVGDGGGRDAPAEADAPDRNAPDGNAPDGDMPGGDAVEAEVPPSARGAGRMDDAIPDFFDEDIDDRPEQGKLARLKAWFGERGAKVRLAMAAAGSVLIIALVGVGIWLYPSSSPQPTGPQNGRDGRGVVINLDQALAEEKARALKASPQGAPEALVRAPMEASSTSTPPPAQAPGADSPFQAVSPQGPGQGMIVPPVTAVSYQDIPTYAGPTTALSAAPDAALLAQGEVGALPIIGPDGRTPLAVYARPYQAKQGEKIALIATGLGLDRAATEAAIRILPPQVSLAFSIYGKGLDYWTQKAREAGHETLLELPMESKAFPVEDPGPHGLLTENSPKENIKQLHYILSRASGYIGVIGTMGSRFTTHEDVLKPIFAELKSRGLLYVDGGDTGSAGPALAAQIGLPRAVVDMKLDDDPSAVAIALKLTALEGVAHKRMVAVATLQAYPVTLRQISAWAATLERKKLELAPVSALADKQLLR